MENFGSLKDILKGHLTRNQISMETEGGIDMLGVAINSAITSIQRDKDFEWNKTTVRVHCNPTGDVTTQAVEVKNGKPVTLKKVLFAYGRNYSDSRIARKIPYLSKSSQVRDDQMAGSMTDQYKHPGLRGETYFAESCSNFERVIHDACEVFILPIPQEDAYDLYFYAIKWMPKLVHTTDTNFLFIYGFDYLIYRSLMELNFYIKEDQRFEINSALLRRAQESLFRWDESLISPTETEIEL